MFELKQNDKVYHLGYLEWYDITDIPSISGAGGKRMKMIPRDPETNMAVAIKSREFNIVSLDAIIQAVHMQPLFAECDSAHQALANKLDVYSFDLYIVNKFADWGSWEKLF